MAAPVIITIFVLLLAPIGLSVLLMLFDESRRPYHRTVRALGAAVIVHFGIMVVLAVLGVVMEGQSLVWVPLLVLGLPVVAVVRIMQLEGEQL